jgi:hypothetical protein
MNQTNISLNKLPPLVISSPPDKFKELIILGLDQCSIPYSLVFAVENGFEILRIGYDKSVYYKGNLITTHKEIGDAFCEWLDLMTVQQIMGS